MKIILNNQQNNIFIDFVKLSKLEDNNIEIIESKNEKILFDLISAGDVDAFILNNYNSYCQKAVDFIKKKHPYILIIVTGDSELNKINNADIYLPYINNHSYYYSLIIKNIINYERNFNILKKLTTRSKENIKFNDCLYDPNIRTLYYRGKEIIKLSEKHGGILEILSINYNKLVKKELILEKVWLKSDYFSSRSMDVYITNLRKIFKQYNIDIKIKNISKSGLVLQ